MDYDPMVSGCFDDWDHFSDWEFSHGPCPNGRWIIGGLPYKVENKTAVRV